MKKFILLISCTILFIIFLTGCTPSEKTTIIGRYLEGKNGSHMIIDECDSPIVMTVQNNNHYLFKDLQNGDKIKIICTPVAESYPGQCGVYEVKLIERGTLDDIEKSTLDILKEMGWVDN